MIWVSKIIIKSISLILIITILTEYDLHKFEKSVRETATKSVPVLTLPSPSPPSPGDAPEVIFVKSLAPQSRFHENLSHFGLYKLHLYSLKVMSYT